MCRISHTNPEEADGVSPGGGSVLIYGIAIWVVFHLFVLTYEEPTLLKTYGSEYENF